MSGGIKKIPYLIIISVIIFPAMVSAFEYRRIPGGLFFTTSDPISLILNSVSLSEFHQEGVCEGKVVDHVAFRFSGGEGGPLWTPDVFDAKSTTTLTLGPGEYDAIALGGYSGESICYLTNMEVHSDNRLIVTKTQCSDGSDNDGDGLTDFKTDGTGDPGCSSANDNDEKTAGDINGDRIVNSLDWSVMNGKWLSADENADLNRDRIVNSLDWSIMNVNWLKMN